MNEKMQSDYMDFITKHNIEDDIDLRTISFKEYKIFIQGYAIGLKAGINKGEEKCMNSHS